MRKSMVMWLAALVVIAGAQAARAADMNKVLRVGFPVDVTGFDPQALTAQLHRAKVTTFCAPPIWPC